MREFLCKCFWFHRWQPLTSSRPLLVLGNDHVNKNCTETMQWDVTCCSQNALSCAVGWPRAHCNETSWYNDPHKIELLHVLYTYMMKYVYWIEVKVSLNDVECLGGKFASTNNYCSQGMLNHIDVMPNHNGYASHASLLYAKLPWIRVWFFFFH